MKVSLKNRSDAGLLYIKHESPYVSGVVGADISLNFIEKFKILFSKGISICLLGPDTWKDRREDN